MEKQNFSANDLAEIIADKVADLLSDQIYETSESIIDEVKKNLPQFDPEPQDVDQLIESCAMWCAAHKVTLMQLLQCLVSYLVGNPS